MQRAAFLPIALLAWGFLGGTAQAQTPIMPTVLGFGDRDGGAYDLARMATVAQNPVGLDECGETIRFRFTNVDVMRASLRFFEGANCNDPMVRTSTTTTSCVELPVPDVAIDGRSQRDVDILASDLVPCDVGGSGVWTIWVLALNNPNDTVSGAGQMVTFPLAYDFIAPSAPTELTSSGGQDRARVEWTATGEQVSEYQIFVDPTGCLNGTVTSPGLTGDPPNEGLIVATATGSARETTVTFPMGVEIGGQMAVAVRGIDRARNVGPLSAPICVDRFEVSSWWAMYCADADAPEVCAGGGGCAAAPGRTPRRAGVLFGALGLAAVWLVRRRPRR